MALEAVQAQAGHAVLGQLDDALSRIDRARHAARANPIASAMVERAAAIAAGDRTASRTWPRRSRQSAARTRRPAPALSSTWRRAGEGWHDASARRAMVASGCHHLSGE